MFIPPDDYREHYRSQPSVSKELQGKNFYLISIAVDSSPSVSIVSQSKIINAISMLVDKIKGLENREDFFLQVIGFHHEVYFVNKFRVITECDVKQYDKELFKDGNSTSLKKAIKLSISECEVSVRSLISRGGTPIVKIIVIGDGPNTGESSIISTDTLNSICKFEMFYISFDAASVVSMAEEVSGLVDKSGVNFIEVNDFELNYSLLAIVNRNIGLFGKNG